MEINQRIQVGDASLANTDFMPNPTVIKVVGVGNGGCNAVNRMIEEGLSGVSFIAMNTDAQMLAHSKADVKIILGRDVTGGLGAGTDPEKGAEAARRDEKTIASILEGANLIFVASGFGGGTGTGASPVISSIAKATGALTIGVVTKPFEMEGRLRMSRAEKGIEQMSASVDSLIVIPNENLNNMFDQDITFENSLKVVDDILRQAVQGISDIIVETGFGMNVDFADVETMVKNSDGRAHLGIGYGKGEKRVEHAVSNAFNNPLLDIENICNASGVLANIVCPKDFGLREHREAMKIVSRYASENANIKVGVCQKEDMHDEVRVTIIATGFEHGGVRENISDIKAVDDMPIEKIEKEVEKTPLTDTVEEEPKIESDIQEAIDIAESIKKSDYTNRINIVNSGSVDENINQNIVHDNTYNNENYQVSDGNYNSKESIIDSLNKPNINSSSSASMSDRSYTTKVSAIKDRRPNFGVGLKYGFSLDTLQDENKPLEKFSDTNEYMHDSLENFSPSIRQEEVDALNYNVDVLPNDEMAKHRELFEKEKYDAYDDVDIDVPAFLRRQIQTKK